MTNLVRNLLYRLHQDDAGQGLAEYVLIFALVALGATAGMLSVASGINSTFTAVGSIFGKYIT